MRIPEFVYEGLVIAGFFVVASWLYSVSDVLEYVLNWRM
jgi:hypothetical protein